MYACIDLGSNSFHLLIAEWRDGRSQIVERFSHLVQLGEGVPLTGEISPAAFARGLHSLRQFVEVMQRYPVRRYWALGTNALRLARNAPEFLEAARLLGLEISVISGTQEAILVYTGVISGLPHSDAVRLIIDIGGGSTEVIVGCGERRFVTHSLPVGCVSWRDRFFSSPAQQRRTLEHNLEKATASAMSVFETVRADLEKHPWSEVYASSGTAKMLAAVCQQTGLSDGVITWQALLALRPLILDCALEPSLLLPGLKDRRKDLLLPGWAVLVALMESYNLGQIHFSSTALREGMLDFMVRKGTDARLLEMDSMPRITHTLTSVGELPHTEL